MDDREYDENVLEQNKQLRMQRKYYRRLHVDDLRILDADEYYESLKDWRKFKAPRDTSKRDAEKDSRVTFRLRIKSFFSDKAKTELKEKLEKAKILQHKYEMDYQKRVNRMRAYFEEEQRQNHESVDEMKSKFMEGDIEQIINFFNSVLENDDFTLDILYRQERYDAASEVSKYDKKTKTLSYKYRIPNPDEICVIDRFVYDGESGEVVEKELDKVHAQKVRLHLLETLLLRSVARVIWSDKYNYVDSVNLTGFLSYYDRAYGNYKEINVAKLQISRDILLQINPERANVSELFERVLKGNFKTATGLYEKEPFRLTEIR
jgi:hypothetical protein